MKKLLAVAVLFTAFSFTSLDANAKKLPEPTNCAQQAWDLASTVCAVIGCTDYQFWQQTNSAYEACLNDN